MRPNVVLIVLDTARADALEPYGAAPGASPAIADLARRGVALNGRSTACWTVPAHASMFTGMLPRASGLIKAPNGTPQSCRPVLESRRDRLLPEVLRRAGYATAAISTNMWLDRTSGFDIGFERFERIDSRRQGRLGDDSLRRRLGWALEGVRARADDGAATAAAVLRRWAEQRRDERPFFWFVNLVECHSPYLPPRPYNDLGPLERARASEDARRFQTMGSIWQACAGGLDVPDESMARMRHLYGRSILALDDWVARTLETLDRRGLLDETVVVVCSDHGENFGENGLIGHAFSLDERLTRVPVVAAGPNVAAHPRPLSLAGIPRWIAETVELTEHPWHPPASGDVAIAQFEPPAPRDDPSWDEAIAAWGVDTEVKDRLAEPLESATDGRLKLVRRGTDESVFDLESDPLEAGPGAAVGDDAAVASLRAALDAAHAEPPAPAPIGAGEEDQLPADELEDLERRMKLLGYM